MKRLILCILFAAFGASGHAKMKEIRTSSITPQGWIREYLVRQQNGLTGNIAVQGYPYNTNMWNGVIPNNGTWWPYEQTGYYLDGAYKLGVLLDDDNLTKPFCENLKWVINNKDKDGMLGPSWRTWGSLWPYAVFFKAFIPYYMETQDREALDAFYKMYSQTVSVETLGIGERHHANIEAVLKLYEWTNDKSLLDKAIKAFDLADKHRVSSDLGYTLMKSNKKLVNHGVTYTESVKIPVMLYMYTGNRDYLDAAEHSIEIIERDHMGPSGVPSSMECLSTKDPMQSHETCVTSDLTWSLGYFLMATEKVKYADMIEKAIFNAAPGAISKHFENLQYFSTDNQVISTNTSNHGREGGREYFGADMTQFSPQSSPACCVGNVHRAMPNFAARMWMTTAEGAIVAALYGPSTLTHNNMVINEETNYPFDDKITFTFVQTNSKVVPFRVRIPEWCSKASMIINGKPFVASLERGTFVTINRQWQNGDRIELTLPMEVKLNRYQNALSVERGPLLYSYGVAERVEVDKKSFHAKFPILNIYPDGEWNYAIDMNESNYLSKIKEIEPDGDGYAFDNEQGVPKLQVPVRMVKGWTLTDDGKYTPPIPIAYQVEDNVKWITLVPYGATRLRITHFPEAITHKQMDVSDWMVSDVTYPYDREQDILVQKFLPELSPNSAKWVSVEPDQTGLVNFDSIMDSSKGLAYVKAMVNADRSGEFFLAINSKDASAIWLNGKLVHTILGPNDVAYQMPDLVKVKLKKGKNQVMMKVGRYGSTSQYRDGWGVKLKCVRHEK